MDAQNNHLPSTPSASSAIDLTGTPTGLTNTAPPSPRQDTSTRRRPSWGRVDMERDPLRSRALFTDPLMADRGASDSGRAVYNLTDVPLYRSMDSDAARGFTYASVSSRYESERSMSQYSTAQSGPSSASLLRNPVDDVQEHDQARLTKNLPTISTSQGWDSYADDEHTVGSPPRRKRYSAAPSPLKVTESALKSVSRSLRRMSLRVVNLAGAGLESQVRLPDDDDDGSIADRATLDSEGLPDLSQSASLRGRTLGFLGRNSRLRLALYWVLMHPWTEPTILVLIILNAVVLTIQSVPTLVLPTASDGSALPPASVKGYFHAWEDYVLFVLFILFTLEAFARICVSGFFLDADVPLSTLFTSAFTPYHEIPNSSTVTINSGLTYQPSLQSQTPLSFTRRLQLFTENLSRPFVLRSHPQARSQATTNGYATSNHDRSDPTFNHHMEDKVGDDHNHRPLIHEPPRATYLSDMLRNDRPQPLSLPFQLSVIHAHNKTRRNLPYLRNSWNRIDFVAIFGFWTSFVLATVGVERGTHHIGIFRALSVLRTARLLAITSGTTTIMHSLKIARPLLANVAYFVLFAIILFSIIGVQSFNGSFRRSCYVSPAQGESYIQFTNQFCGGHIDPRTLNVVGYISLSGGSTVPKGYICPLGSVCMEQQNPNSNVSSFDAIYYSMLQIVIVASTNGWSPIMYGAMEAENFISCLFFIICVIVLNFWLINLFVAVITNAFSAIRSNSSKSAFGAAALSSAIEDQDTGWVTASGSNAVKTNPIMTFYSYTKWVWVLLALLSLGLQATRTVNVSATHQMIMDIGELAITIAFDVEIILRVLGTLPKWRTFFVHTNNWLDLFLAIVTTIIQIPVIHHSSVYPWLTIFQLARFYRVILEFPRMRPLLLSVFGNMYGLINMTLFLLLVNYIAALAASQLMRGDLPTGDPIQPLNFGEIFTSFLAIYQICSSENWTSVLYTATSAEISLGQTIIVAIFLSCWLLFANFIVLQMFIAVINENFQVAEEAKKEQQASNYVANYQAEVRKPAWMRRLNPYRWVRANPVRVRVEHLPSNLVLPIQEALVNSYTVPRSDSNLAPLKRPSTGVLRGLGRYSGSFNTLQRLFAGSTRSYDVPLTTFRSDNALNANFIDEETERHLEMLAALSSDATTTEDLGEALHERRAQKADFIRDHPSFDRAFWLFGQENSLRRFCQKLVQPAGGDRIYGVPPSKIAHPIFQLLLLLAVIGGIAVEGVATPLYRRTFYLEHGLTRDTWFTIAEAVLGMILLVEFLIKIIADGFMFTPNAYIRSIWNILDFIILVGLLVNLTTSLIFIGGLSRFTRSLKALRALRLITLLSKMRDTFESLIISGVFRIIDAAILAILYMIPYAVWGLNIFAGDFKECNDASVSGISDCIHEFDNTVYGTAFGFPSPRVWNDPNPSTTFSFDSFKASLLILFEIVSLEGWVDVMNAATSIVGPGLQPQTNSTQYNAIFFVIYNLLGGVVILTLFVSIIIGNFMSKTGWAFYTQPQREWIDLEKLIRRQRPSKRPKVKPTARFRSWCFDRAVHKHGFWARTMTLLFLLHIAILMTQAFSNLNTWDSLRDDFFLGIALIYIVDVTIRLYGLGWRSFRANQWNIFDIIVAGGSFIATLVVRLGSSGYATQQLQKLFLVSIAFKLVQRSNSLNKLFKTAISSLPVILSLLGFWVILFIFFAILYMEVFGLTKWNSAETSLQNYSSMGSAFVMLAFMTTGENWNQYMHDYAIVYPRCTNPSSTDLDSDCGSIEWAYSLFIAWNILSMYIFAFMFTGVVVESFSYVFTSSGRSNSITREEMRSFKKLWSEFANPKTERLERHSFWPFFAKLSGVFEVRIYPMQYSRRNILAAARVADDPSTSKTSHGVDLNKLNSILDGIDYASIRKRRATYSRLYHEAKISGPSISFTDMLLLLAHHKIIVDRDALVLEDLVLRTEKNKLVTDLVNLDRVKSLLKMLSLRRRFLIDREQKRMAQAMVHSPSTDIPTIVVDVHPTTPSLSTRDITSSHGGSPVTSEPFSPSSNHPSPQSPRVSFSLELGTSPNLQRSRRRESDMSMLSTDLGIRSPRKDQSPSEEDPQNILTSMQNSMWGEMMLQAAEEDA